MIIIALGESLLVTGNSFADTDWDAATITSFVSAFLVTIAMWWIYFSLVAEPASERLEHSARTGGVARLIYTYIHFLIVPGIVLTAVADEFVLTHARDSLDTATLVAVLGGPALYLGGNILFKTLMFNSHPRPHYIGLMLLALALTIHHLITPPILALFTTGILIVVACWETVSILRSD